MGEPKGQDVRIAVFDLDRTLTRAGTYIPFLLHCVAAQGRSRLGAVLQGLPAATAYGFGRETRAAFKARVLECSVAGRSRAEVMAWAGVFAGRWLETRIRPGAHAALARHRAEGDRLVMATAAFDFYAGLFAEALGFDELIATASVWEGDRLRAAVAGENCYGPAKLAAVRATVAGLNPRPRIVAYSDHHSDFELLRWADEGVAVNPTTALRRLAVRYGLKVADWGAAI